MLAILLLLVGLLAVAWLMTRSSKKTTVVVLSPTDGVRWSGTPEGEPTQVWTEVPLTPEEDASGSFIEYALWHRTEEGPPPLLAEYITVFKRVVEFFQSCDFPKVPSDVYGNPTKYDVYLNGSYLKESVLAYVQPLGEVTETQDNPFDFFSRMVLRTEFSKGGVQVSPATMASTFAHELVHSAQFGVAIGNTWHAETLAMAIEAITVMGVFPDLGYDSTAALDSTVYQFTGTSSTLCDLGAGLSFTTEAFGKVYGDFPITLFAVQANMNMDDTPTFQDVAREVATRIRASVGAGTGVFDENLMDDQNADYKNPGKLLHDFVSSLFGTKPSTKWAPSLYDVRDRSRVIVLANQEANVRDFQNGSVPTDVTTGTCVYRRTEAFPIDWLPGSDELLLVSTAVESEDGVFYSVVTRLVSSTP